MLIIAVLRQYILMKGNKNFPEEIIMDKNRKVINFHITDLCNYRCRFCFVKKENITASIEDLEKCVDKIDRYFKDNNITDGRINLAGGEPLIYREILKLIDYIYSKGIKVSIITNGSLLTKEFIDQIRGKVEMIGISIDSLCDETNIAIGRCYNKEQVCDKNFYTQMCKLIKKANIKLKVNICVNNYNKNENFKEFFEDVRPDRIKFLQMKVEEGVNDNQTDLVISKEDFEKFADTNKFENAVVESDEDIKESYIILDSKCDISTSNNHNSEMSLLQNSFEECLASLDFDDEKYQKRYTKQ